VFVSIAVLAALAGGCGSDEPEPSGGPEPASTPEQVKAETHGFEKGHSAAIRKYYGDVHEHGAEGDVEAEYHQPPRPAKGAIGDTITLTGSNIGVRMKVKVTGVVDPAEASPPASAGNRYVAVKLGMRSTGIAVLDGELRSGLLSYDGGRAEVAFGVEADCSNGFQAGVRIDDTAPKSGCLVFEIPESARPREVQFALEQVPAEVGGRWRLR